MYKLLIPLILLFSETTFSSQYDDLLYQKNDDIEFALKFIGTPKDKIDTIKPIVRGELGNKKLEYVDDVGRIRIPDQARQL